MKDTVITARRKRIEIITLLVCFIIANLLNVYAIASHDATWAELITSIGYVAVGACALYVMWTVLRLIALAISLIFRKNNH
ncbi:MAG: hypothetical protein PUD30_00650 [Muribaculaceae bacterium]|nr:hypothetical protein [Muribaculaceae bacterium]MDY3931993.1 hypothetical protein [Muribaculaceae bacterium]